MMDHGKPNTNKAPLTSTKWHLNHYWQLQWFICHKSTADHLHIDFQVNNFPSFAQESCCGKEPTWKVSDEGETAWIKSNGKNDEHFQFTYDGRKRLVSLQRILRQADINTLARQNSIMISFRYNCSRFIIQGRDITINKQELYSTTMKLVYNTLIDSNWTSDHRKINDHPLLTNLWKRGEKDFGWLCKEEAETSNNTVKMDIKHIHLNNTCIQ